jgi:VanZ family protein
MFGRLPVRRHESRSHFDRKRGVSIDRANDSWTTVMRFFILHAARIVGWCLSAIITVLSLVPPKLRPETAAPHNLEHFAIFFAAAVAFGFGYNRRPGIVAVALVIFAGAIEIAQILVPGRHARWSDFVVDAVALCIGVAMGYFVGARTLQRSAPSAEQVEPTKNLTDLAR